MVAETETLVEEKPGELELDFEPELETWEAEAVVELEAPTVKFKRDVEFNFGPEAGAEQPAGKKQVVEEVKICLRRNRESNSIWIKMLKLNWIQRNRIEWSEYCKDEDKSRRK